MKKYYFLLIAGLSLLTVSSDYAQTSCNTDPVPVLPEDFPIAAFWFNTYDCNELNLWKSAGLNLVYNDHHGFKKISGTISNTIDPLAPQLGLNSGMKSFINFNELYGGTDVGNDFVKNHRLLGVRQIGSTDGNESKEYRYFLASNFDQLGSANYDPDHTFAYDLYNDKYNIWKVKTGLATANFEWYLNKANFPADNVLVSLELDGADKWYGPGGHTLNFIIPDFIFHIDEAEWVATNGSTPSNAALFHVNYYLKYNDGQGQGETFHLFYTDDISYDTYIARGFSYSGSGYMQNEASDIKDFPNIKFQPTVSLQSHPYAVVRSENLPSTTFGHSVTGLKCEVTSDAATGKVVGLYVRGFRLRTQVADDILSGRKDGDLKSVFDDKKASLINTTSSVTGATAWDNLLNFTTGSEPTVESFRTDAYIDALCYKRIGKHMFPFLSNNVPFVSRPYWYRAIYEEQTGMVPGPISMEDLERFDDPHKLPIPADGIPFELRNDNGFRNTYFFSIAGRNAAQFTAGLDVNPYATGLQTQNATGQTNGIFTYADYTNAMQKRFQETDPNTYLMNFRSCARAINPPWANNDPLEYGKYYAHLSLITTFADCISYKAVDNTVANCEGPVTNATTRAQKETVADKILNMMRNKLQIPFPGTSNIPDEEGSLFPSPRMDYLDYKLLSPETSTPPACLLFDPDQKQNFTMAYRPALRTELRAHLWNAICYGAQGIVINPTGTDFGGNIGWMLTGSGFDWKDLSNVTHHVADLDYVIGSDHSFTAFLIRALFGSCSTPAVPPASIPSEQSSASVFTHHIVIVGVKWNATPGGTDLFGAVYQTIPIFNSDGTPIDESPSGTTGHTNFIDYINSNSSDFDGALSSHSPVLHKAVSTVQRSNWPNAGGHTETVATDQWVFIKENWDCANLTMAATREEFRGTFLTTGDGGTWIKNSELNYDDRSFDDHPFYVKQFHYPHAIVGPALYFNTFYGFKEKNIGGKRVIADLAPIAKQLSQLHWITGVNYSHLFTTANIIPKDVIENRNNFSKFPLLKYTGSTSDQNYDNTNIASFKFKRLGTPWQLKDHTVDNSDLYPDNTDGDANLDKFYELGVFLKANDDPANPSELFVSIANKRTWPMFIDPSTGQIVEEDATDNGHSAGNRYKFLGGVDARRFSFKIDRTKFKNGSNYSLFNVTDLRNGREKLMSVAGGTIDTFCCDFEPGEGTLLRIVPAYSFTAGRTSKDGMEYNNGRRVAELHNGGILAFNAKRIMVWEREGKIQFALINNPGRVGEDNFIASAVNDPSTPITNNTLDNTGLAMNPSVAAFSDEGNGKDIIGVIWSRNETGTNATRKVYFNWALFDQATNTLSWHANTPTQVDAVNYNSQFPDQLVTPSITAAISGFFAAWSTPIGIQPAMLELTSTNGGLYNTEATNKLGLQKADPLSHTIVFPSVASRADLCCNMENLHLAWEEDFGSYVNPFGLGQNRSQIYYKYYSRNAQSDAVDESTTIERVSKHAPTCEHHHPNIAVTNDYYVDFDYSESIDQGRPIITWEWVTTGESSTPSGGMAVVRTISVVARERYPWGWGSFTTFYPKVNNLPLPVLQSASFISTTMVTPPFWSNYQHFTITAQDSTSNEVHVFRENEDPWLFFSWWDHSKLIENAELPSMALQYYPTDVGPANIYTFRSIDKDLKKLYSARITSRDARSSAGIEKKVDDQFVQEFDATPLAAPCETDLKYAAHRGQQIFLIGGTDTIYFDWRQWEFLNHDSTYYKDSTLRTYTCPRIEDSVRTNSLHIHTGDSVRMDRLFKISDPSLLTVNYFPDNSRFITFEVDLKDSVSHAFVQVVDKVSVVHSASGVQILDMHNLPLILFQDSTGIYSINPKNPIPLSVPPSGYGYLTLKITKDSATPLVLVQSQKYMDGSSSLNVPPSSASYKIASMPASHPYSGSKIILSIHPNPFRTKTDVELDVQNDTPLNVTVFDVLGRSITSLFNDVSTKDHYSFTLDSKQLSPGMYFIRVQAGSEVVTRKVEMLK